MELQYLLYLMSRMIVGSQTRYVDTSFDHISHVSHLMRLVVLYGFYNTREHVTHYKWRNIYVFEFATNQKLEFNADISVSSPS